jgi:hypothetical protein
MNMMRLVTAFFESNIPSRFLYSPGHIGHKLNAEEMSAFVIKAEPPYFLNYSYCIVEL